MYNIYIGSNNETGELEKEKIIRVISWYFKSFTFYEVSGYWINKEEKTLKVEIITNSKEENDNIILLCNALKKDLQQDTILLSYIKSDNTFI